MNNRNKTEELNALIEKANKLLEQYNELSTPLIKAKLELEYHNELFSHALSKEDANKEDVILSDLKKTIDNLTPRQRELAEMDTEIQSLFGKIEALEKEISGTSNPDSPSFLMKK